MLIGTAVFLSLIVALLAIPVTLTYRLCWKQTLAANIRLKWAFGLVCADVSPDNTTAKADKPGASRNKVVRPDKPQARKVNFMAALRQASFRRRMIRFLSDVWHAVHKKNVRLLVRMGLGDPADTGQLWAVLGPLSGMLASLRDISIAIEPDFVDTTFEVDSSGTIRLIPLQFTILALGLLFSPPMWRGVMLMRTSG